VGGDLVTVPTIGSMRVDHATGRLLLNGEPVCSGCHRPSTTRFCRPMCRVKWSNERQYLRTHITPIRAWKALAMAGVR
jgi:hypothetical protein